MNIYKILTEDKFLCLEKMSFLFKEEEKPSIILHDNKSPEELVEKFLSLYDVKLKDSNCRANILESDTVVTYSGESFSLALFAFPIFAGRALFIEEKKLKSLNILCKDLIILGDMEIEKIPAKNKVYQLLTEEGILSFSKKVFSTLVLINSKDLESTEENVFCTNYKCAGLSLLGSYIASVRDGLIYDASSDETSDETEKAINNSDRYKNINNIIAVGTSGSLPFVRAEYPDFAVGYNWMSDIIRDYTIWKGDFVKSSQGRITGINILDASLLFQRGCLVKSSKVASLNGVTASDSITCLEEMGAAAEVPTIRTNTGIIAHNMKKCGWEMTELYGEDNCFSKIRENLENSRFFYIGNHGILLYIRCKEKSLGAEDLPSFLPGTQIFCLSCLTARTTGLWLSTNEIDWYYGDTPLEKNLPLTAIRNGASSFMGLLMAGYELEADALMGEVLKNMTFFGKDLGEAVKEARNTITALYKYSLMILGYKARGNYQQIKFYGRITVNEPVIYGDPRQVLPVIEEKFPEGYIKCRDVEDIKEISLNIPKDCWEIIKMPVKGKSQEAYSTKSFHAYYPHTPYSVMGGFFPLKKDPGTYIAEEIITYYYIKVKTDLPPGSAVKFIELTDVKILDAVDFEGNKLHISYLNPFEIMGRFYYGTSLFEGLQELDIKGNWPFALEEGEEASTLWFFVPSTAVVEKPGIIARLLSADFKVHYCKGHKISGRVISEDKTPLDAILTFRGPGGKVNMADTGVDGNYSVILPPGKHWLFIESDLHKDFRKEINIDSDKKVDFEMTLKRTHPVSFKVCDGDNEEPLCGATVKCFVLFGPRDKRMIEGYTKGKEKYPHRFLKEYVTDEEGRVEDNLVEGYYILDIFKRKEKNSAIYHRNEYFLEVSGKVEDKIFKLTPAATVRGYLVDKKTDKGIPDSTVLVTVKTDKKEKSMRFHSDMDGYFCATVPAGKNLTVSGAFEGYGTEKIEMVLKKGEIKEIKLHASAISN